MWLLGVVVEQLQGVEGMVRAGLGRCWLLTCPLLQASPAVAPGLSFPVP